MLDFFVTFSHGGIVLWSAEGTKALIRTSVNSLIQTHFQNLILQEQKERTDDDSRNSITTASFDNGDGYGSRILKFKVDHEFELVFLAGYRKFLNLSYVDKFLMDFHQKFRADWHNHLKIGQLQVGNFGRGRELWSVFHIACTEMYGTCLKEAKDVTYQIWEEKNKNLVNLSGSHARKPKRTYTCKKSPPRYPSRPPRSQLIKITSELEKIKITDESKKGKFFRPLTPESKMDPQVFNSMVQAARERKRARDELGDEWAKDVHV